MGLRARPLPGETPSLAHRPSARGVSGGGGLAGARKPGAAQESWLELRAFPPRRAGAIPGRAGRAGRESGDINDREAARRSTKWTLTCTVTMWEWGLGGCTSQFFKL